VIDRTFIDAGIRWIIDYKFTRPTDLETSAQFAQRQLNYYKGQLNHYARLYREMGPEPVRCALYFPQIGMFSAVTTE
jgi:ATP-dependent exoDNAse (exonuclease V) beta subunit